MRNKFLMNFFRGGPNLQKSVFTYLIIAMLVCLQITPAFASNSKDDYEIEIRGHKKVLIPSTATSYCADVNLQDLVWSVTKDYGASLENDESNTRRTRLDISDSAKDGDIVSLYVYSKDNPSTDGSLDVKLTDNKSEIQGISLDFIDYYDRTQIIPSTGKKEIQLSSILNLETYDMVRNSKSENDFDKFDIDIFKNKSFTEKDFDPNGLSISDSKLIIESSADEGEYIISAKLKEDPYVNACYLPIKIRKPLVNDIQISGLSEIIIPENSSIIKRFSADLICDVECHSDINWRLDKEYENIDLDSRNYYANLSFSPDISEGDIVLIAECEGVERQKTIKISKTTQSLYEPAIVDFDPRDTYFSLSWDYPVEVDESTEFFIQYNAIDKPYVGFSSTTSSLYRDIKTLPLNVLCRDDAVEIEISLTAIKGEEQKTTKIKKLIPLNENRAVELNSYVMDSSNFSFTVEDFPSCYIDPDSDSVIAEWCLIDEKALKSYYESNKDTYFNTYFKELLDNRDITPERGMLLKNGTITKKFNKDLKSGKYILGFMTKEGSYGCDIVVADQTEDIYKPVDVDYYYDSMAFNNPCITWSYAGPLDESDKMFVYVYPENKPYLAQKYEYHPEHMYDIARMAAFDEIDTSNSGRKYEFHLSEIPFSIMKSFLKDGENNLNASIILERGDTISRSEEIDVPLDVVKSEMKLSSNSFSSNDLRFKNGILENLKIESLKTNFKGNENFDIIIDHYLGEYPWVSWALIDENEWSKCKESTLLTNNPNIYTVLLDAFNKDILLTGGSILSDGSLKFNTFNVLPQDKIENLDNLHDGNYELVFLIVTENNDANIQMKSPQHSESIISIASKTITVQTATSISISGDSSIEIPKNGSTTKNYTAIMKDKNGKPIENEKFSWNLDKEYVGISTDKTSGRLSVSKDAKAGKIKLTATSASAPEITKEFEITITEPSSGSGGSSGGGGSSHSHSNSNDNHYFKDKDIKTNDDKKLDDSMSSKGKAEVSLDNDPDKKIKISPKIIDKLSKEKKPLLIKNDDIQLTFAPLSLETEELKNALKDKDARVELKVEEISNSEKTEIMKDASLDKKGLDDIGAPVYDIKAKTTSDKSSDNVDHFFEPVAVTIELSDVKLNDEDIAKLTGVIYHKDENGNTIPVKLGGSYDKKTNSFTYYTDCPDMCSVVEADEILEIDLTINEKEGKVNHKTKMNDVEPVIINDRTMIPLRFISENLGANVKWVPETQTVEIDYDGQKLSMVIDQPIDGFDTPPTIRNDRTLVPSRYVSEKLGAYVMWFPEEKTVKITK